VNPRLVSCCGKEFRIGQLYGSARDRTHFVALADRIQTTLTTQGYLSNGNSHPLILNGDFGNDFFDVLRNKQGTKFFSSSSYFAGYDGQFTNDGCCVHCVNMYSC
jgi:hypothetical protein